MPRRRRDALGAAGAILRRIGTRVAATLGTVPLRSGRAARTVKLDDVRRRLELLVTAVYDRPIPIATVESPRRPVVAWRDAFRPRHLRQSVPLPATDGERIQLPREIESLSLEHALAQYRLMAIEQAERIVRNTAARLPVGNQVERDLYLMREGAVIDASIARSVPGLRATLATARAHALETRPSLAGLTARERAAEALLREALAVDLTTSSTALASASPDESLTWAREQVQALADVRGKYRGLSPVASWGALTIRPQRVDPLPKADELATFRGSKYGIGQFGRGSGTGGKQASEGGAEEGTSQFRQSGEVVLHPEGPRRVASPGVGDSTSAESDPGAGDPSAVDDEPQAEPAQRESAVARDARAAATRRPAHARSRVPSPRPVAGEGIEYPEWDWQTGDYRPTGAVVRRYAPDITDDTWGTTVLARHGAIVRRLREQFDRLRARRARLTQQRDGDELDLTACVRAWVDQRTGHTIDDRLYIAVRPARRGIAIALLIDISGSTDEWIDARRRVIDVEKIALLLASEALDALGDDYAILTFSGKGSSNVRMRTIKAFDEPNGLDVRRRVAALEPEGYTRAGAAIRHAAALLERQPAAHRLLLLLSDGKPNDVDGYEGLSGVEDTRQAINEARARGVYPFCLTIDRQGQEYLGRIFGEAGHTVLRNPRQLPTALVKVVKHLLAS